MNILILRTSSIGDVIQTLPGFHALRRRFPAAHIAWMIDPESREVLDGCDGVDEILTNPLPNGRHFQWRRDFRHAPFLLRQAGGFRKLLREKQFDVVLELQGLFRTGIWCRLSGAPQRIGLADNTREFSHRFVNERVAPLGKHTVERLASPAAHLGAEVNQLGYEYRVPSSGREFAERFLESASNGESLRPLVAVNPGASWRINRWPPEKLAEAANLVQKQTGARLVLIGSRGDIESAEQIARQLESPPLMAAGQTTLTELAGLMEHCGALITADTGPMHLATAVGTPVVAIFGPSDPTVSGPYSKKAIVVETPLPCRPCWRRPVACQGRIDCLQMITAQQVADACVRLMEQFPVTALTYSCPSSASQS